MMVVSFPPLTSLTLCIPYHFSTTPVLWSRWAQRFLSGWTESDIPSRALFTGLCPFCFFLDPNIGQQLTGLAETNRWHPIVKVIPSSDNGFHNATQRSQLVFCCDFLPDLIKAYSSPLSSSILYPILN
jgi:hypothetical protein